MTAPAGLPLRTRYFIAVSLLSNLPDKSMWVRHITLQGLSSDLEIGTHHASNFEAGRDECDTCIAVQQHDCVHLTTLACSPCSPCSATVLCMGNLAVQCEYTNTLLVSWSQACQAVKPKFQLSLHSLVCITSASVHLLLSSCRT